jgi:hypothetical protein
MKEEISISICVRIICGVDDLAVYSKVIPSRW